MQELLGRWCSGQELNFGSSSGEWDHEMEVIPDGPCGDGLGFIKRIVPVTDTKTLNLIGVDQRVIQFCATMEGFVHNKGVCVVGDGVIPGCSSGNNRNI